VTRLAAFAASAFLAGVAGALLAAAAGNVKSAVIAAALLAVAPAYVPDELVAHQALVFGATTVALLAVRGMTIRLRTTRATERLGASPVRARLQEQGAPG
jgi:hypothetical protein